MAEYPSSYTFTLAVFIILAIFIHAYWQENKKTTPARIKLLDLMREAEKKDWCFIDGDNQHAFDFIRELRSAGTTNDVKFWGRKKLRYDFKSSDQPLIEIKAGYWHDFLIDVLTCLKISSKDGTASGLAENNIFTATGDDANREQQNRYFDIQLDRKQAMEWLKTIEPNE
tara:strand:- start:479 stop:988 length:510 start_codon:yes stop_codon:yes gene_type:complete